MTRIQTCIETLKARRDHHQKCISGAIAVTLMLLVIFTLAWLVVIAAFIGHDMFEGEQTSMMAMQKVATFYMISGLIVLLVVLCCGCQLNRMEAPSTWMVVLFGCFLFFFGVIPFYGEAAAFAVVGRLEDEDIATQCAILNIDQKSNEDKYDLINRNFTRRSHKYMELLYSTAAKFDNQAAVLLDQNMCTDVCPCFQIEHWTYKKGIKMFRDDPKAEYGRLSEEILNAHNRTMIQNSTKFKPFVFTNDARKGVISFLECFERWFEKAEDDPSIDLMALFGMSWHELKKPFKKDVKISFFKGKEGENNIEQRSQAARKDISKLMTEEDRKQLDKWNKMSWEEREENKEKFPELWKHLENLGVLEEFLEFDFIAGIEEGMRCSGVCKSALFYWEKDIYSGYPEEPCAYAMVDFFRGASRPLKATLRVVATDMLFLFILHFTFYGKSPKKPEETQANDEDLGVPAQDPLGEPDGGVEMQQVESDAPGDVVAEDKPDVAPPADQVVKENNDDEFQFKY